MNPTSSKQKGRRGTSEDCGESARGPNATATSDTRRKLGRNVQLHTLAGIGKLILHIVKRTWEPSPGDRDKARERTRLRNANSHTQPRVIPSWFKNDQRDSQIDRNRNLERVDQTPADSWHAQTSMVWRGPKGPSAFQPAFRPEGPFGPRRGPDDPKGPRSPQGPFGPKGGTPWPGLYVHACRRAPQLRPSAELRRTTYSILPASCPTAVGGGARTRQENSATPASEGPLPGRRRRAFMIIFLGLHVSPNMVIRRLANALGAEVCRPVLHHCN